MRSGTARARWLWLHRWLGLALLVCWLVLWHCVHILMVVLKGGRIKIIKVHQLNLQITN